MEEYRQLTPEQKSALREKRKAQAIEQVKTGKFPTGVRVKIGDFTLTARPSGVSDKGSVSYGLSPMVITVGAYKLRVNNISLSVLNDTTPELTAEELEAGETI